MALYVSDNCNSFFFFSQTKDNSKQKNAPQRWGPELYLTIFKLLFDTQKIKGSEFLYTSSNTLKKKITSITAVKVKKPTPPVLLY